MRSRSIDVRPPAAVVLLLALLAAAGCTGRPHPRAVAPPPPVPETWRLDYTDGDSTLFDVAPVSRDEGWAIGQTGTDHVLLRRQGGTWQRAALPLPTTKGLFNQHLAASAADDVWLFAGAFGPTGAGGDPTEIRFARRWDGRQWLTVPIDFTASDVAVLAPDDVWAIDADPSRSHHWDGRAWTGYALPYPASALSAADPHTVWAVGRRDDPSGRTRSQPAAMRFDGTAWQPVPTPEHRSPTPNPGETATLSEVVAVAANNAWAFGDLDADPDATGPGDRHTVILLRWDGSAWHDAPAGPAYTPDLHPFPAMAATGDGAGGFVLAAYQHGTATGRLRAIGPPPGAAGTSSPAGQFRVNELHLMPGTRDVWAAGFLDFGTSGTPLRGVIAVCTLNG